MFWIGCLTDKGLSREVAAGKQLNWFLRAFCGKIIQESVEFQTRLEESSRDSRQVASRQRELGQIRAF